MSNDETRPLPAEGPAPARADGARVDGVNGADGARMPPAPPSPWATTQPVVQAAPSPYGPPVSAQQGSAQAPPAQPATGWPEVEPDPWVDVTPGRVEDAPAFVAPGSRPPGQGRGVLGVLGVIGLVVAGALAGALIVNAVDGFGGSNTAGVQPGGVTRNGSAPNGVAPGGAPGGVQGGTQGAVPGGQGLRGAPGQDGEQRLTGTLTAVSGSKVTLQMSSGSATYQLVSQTQIVRDGALASASDLKAGDRVLVHVLPANGSDGVLERLIAVSGTGTSGTQGTQDDDDTADT
jgi:hypothetical protein